MANYVEPLEASIWFQRIEMIANGTLGSVERSLRHASHLLQLTPRALRPSVGLAIGEEAFETLLDASDFDTAARHLVATPSALSVEEADGTCLVRATIQCPVRKRAIEGTGGSVADAVLAAWTTCMLAMRTQYGADLTGLVQRLPQETDSDRVGNFVRVEGAPQAPNKALGIDQQRTADVTTRGDRQTS